MTTIIKLAAERLSRRTFFQKTTVMVGAGALVSVGLCGGQALAAAKLAQKSVSYQDAPKGRARCDACAQWVAPSSCKLVTGTINPAGWCTIFAPKS